MAKIGRAVLTFAVLFILFGSPLRVQASETYRSGDVITISSETKIDRMYILWDTIPGQWILTVDGREYRYGEYDFLHEYIEPEQGGYEWKITIAQDKTKVGEIHTFEEGEALPDWVQIWEPPCEDADLVVFPTHADDELIFFGGTLPYYAGELGYQVQVVYLTNHWKWAPYRNHELLNGLWACGVRNYPVIGPFEDKYSKNNLEEAKGMYDLDEIRAFQVRMLRKFTPEVILLHDINGEYGHSVHMLNTVMMMESVELAADPDFMPEDVAVYGVWDTPKTYIHYWQENRIEMNWDQPLETFDGKDAFQVAEEAFLCHDSQVKYFKLSRKKKATGCTLFGLYRSLVGEDVEKNDFFENIDMTVDEEEEPVEDENVSGGDGAEGSGSAAGDSGISGGDSLSDSGGASDSGGVSGSDSMADERDASDGDSAADGSGDPDGIFAAGDAQDGDDAADGNLVRNGLIALAVIGIGLLAVLLVRQYREHGGLIKHPEKNRDSGRK